MTKRYHGVKVLFKCNKRAQLAQLLFEKIDYIENRHALKMMSVAWAAMGKTSTITWGDLYHIMPSVGFYKQSVLSEKKHMIPVWVREEVAEK